MTKEAQKYRDNLSSDRIQSLEYYEGIMKDLPADKGKSKVVVRVTRAAIQKALPSLIRTFLGSDEIFEFQPQTEQEKESAQQQSDYLNYVVLPESNGFNAIHDALWDALTTRNGILYAYCDERKKITYAKYSGQTQEQLQVLAQDDSVEIVKKWPDGIDKESQQPLFGCQIKRTDTQKRIKSVCVDPENFLIDPNAMDIEDADFVGVVTRMSRSDLIAMGYDRNQVMGLTLAKADANQAETERRARRGRSTDDETAFRTDQRAKELQQVDYYELFVRLDFDGDGIAELHRLCFGGDVTVESWLNPDDHDWDEVPFADIAVKRKSHQREGISLTDDLAEIQRNMSYFLRQTVDNITWQNNLMMIYQEGGIQGDSVKDLYSPSFGKVLRTAPGQSVKDTIGFLEVPFVAKDTFAMLDWLKAEGEQRSGITDGASGLDPEALQNITAKATAMMEQGGIGQVELMARIAASGLERFARIVMKLVIKHADRARTVQLRDKFVEVDPRTWNADLNVTANTGLGAGSRERDLMAIQQVLKVQQTVMGMLGNSPLVSYEQISNSLKRFAEAAGLKRPLMYFGQPDKDQIAAFEQHKASQPTPEQQKMQAEMQAQQQAMQAEMQFKMQEAQLKAEVDKHKEVVQSQAAVAERQAVAQIESAQKQQELDVKKYEIDQRTMVDLLKLHVTDIAAAQDQSAKAELERDRLTHENENKTRDREMTMAQNDMAAGQDGKPKSAVHDMLKAFIDAQSKPKQVKTPDGEVFTMETVQ